MSKLTTKEELETIKEIVDLTKSGELEWLDSPGFHYCKRFEVEYKDLGLQLDKYNDKFITLTMYPHGKSPLESVSYQEPFNELLELQEWPLKELLNLVTQIVTDKSKVTSSKELLIKDSILMTDSGGLEWKEFYCGGGLSYFDGTYKDKDGELNLEYDLFRKAKYALEVVHSDGTISKVYREQELLKQLKQSIYKQLKKDKGESMVRLIAPTSPEEVEQDILEDIICLTISGELQWIKKADYSWPNFDVKYKEYLLTLDYYKEMCILQAHTNSSSALFSKSGNARIEELFDLVEDQKGEMLSLQREEFMLSMWHRFNGTLQPLGRISGIYNWFKSLFSFN